MSAASVPAGSGVDPELLQILACPRDRGPLEPAKADGGEAILVNPRLGTAYRIDDGIPVLLVDEARPLTDSERERISGTGSR